MHHLHSSSVRYNSFLFNSIHIPPNGNITFTSYLCQFYDTNFRIYTIFYKKKSIKQARLKLKV